MLAAASPRPAQDPRLHRAGAPFDRGRRPGVKIYIRAKLNNQFEYFKTYLKVRLRTIDLISSI